MRVLVLHNAYRQPGGEDAVVRNEVALLREKGHDVLLHQVSNDEIGGPFGKLLAALSAVFSIPAYFLTRRLIRKFRPDVVHVHNVFPILSPSVFYACGRERILSVLTLHNYRVACPTALLMHDGLVTERSLVDGPWWAVRHRVYRGSLVGTAVVAATIAVHRRLGTWSRTVTRFIALTSFSVSRFELAGIPRARMRVKPNFVDVRSPGATQRLGYLVVGRLSREKGVEVLAAAMMRCPDVSVRVAGEGPMMDTLRKAPRVELLGMMPAGNVSREMSAARALVMPSICYEGFPMVIVEAYAHGLPVIASRLGAMAELVEDGVTGLLFEPGSGEDLARKIQWAQAHPEEMSRMGLAARARYEASYTAEVNYKQLIDIYRDAIAAKGAVR